MREPKEPVSFQLPEHKHELLLQMAAEEGLTLDQFTERALKEYLKREAERRELPQGPDGGPGWKARLRGRRRRIP